MLKIRYYKYVLLVLLFILLSCSSLEIINEIEKYKYLELNSKIEIYNLNGNLIKEYLYYLNINDPFVNEYKYNKEGFLIRKDEFNDLNELFSFSKYYYSKDGTLKKEKYYPFENNLNVIIKYDKYENKIYENIISLNIKTKWKLDYDSFGNLVLNNTFYDRGNTKREIYKKLINTYDKTNKIINISEYDKNNRIKSYKEYEYNNSSKIIKIRNYKNESKKQLLNEENFDYFYNENQNLIKEIEYYNLNEIKRKIELKYEFDNKIKSEIVIENNYGSTKKERVKYIYDDKRNLISKIYDYEFEFKKLNKEDFN